MVLGDPWEGSFRRKGIVTHRLKTTGLEPVEMSCFSGRVHGRGESYQWITSLRDFRISDLRIHERDDVALAEFE